MAELHFKIKYKESTNELKYVKHKNVNAGGYENKWRKMEHPPTPKPDVNDDDCIKLWPKERSCRYVYHHGNWYTNC